MYFRELNEFEKEIKRIHESLSDIYDSLYPNGSFYMGDIGVESRPNMLPETMQASFPIKINIRNVNRTTVFCFYTNLCIVNIAVRHC